MWQALKSFCLNSATIAWSYCLAFLGVVMQLIDSASDVLGDPSFKDTLHNWVGDAKTFGQIILGISIINIIARLRTLRKGL